MVLCLTHCDGIGRGGGQGEELDAGEWGWWSKILRRGKGPKVVLMSRVGSDIGAFDFKDLLFLSLCHLRCSC